MASGTLVGFKEWLGEYSEFILKCYVNELIGNSEKKAEGGENDFKDCYLRETNGMA